MSHVPAPALWHGMAEATDLAARGIVDVGNELGLVPLRDTQYHHIILDGCTVEVIESDVVCFQSAPPDEQGLHEAVIVSKTTALFPQNTLFRLLDVQHGWRLADGEGFARRRGLISARPVYRRLVGVPFVIRVGE